MADLNGAAVALVRLHELYNFDKMEFKDGIIDKKYTQGNTGRVYIQQPS